MRSNFRLTALVFAVVALLAPAPAAIAKGGGGGGGGGGGTCATIDSFAMSSGYVDGQPSVTWSATTTNTCIDEFAGSTGIDFSNSQDGFTGRAVYFGRGTMSFGSTSVAKPNVKYTITVSVYTPSGKLVASQTKSATTGLALTVAG